MTCERYAGDEAVEAAERYVAGRMTPDEAAAFEQHYLACDACLETVRGVEDVRDVLAERQSRRDIPPATSAGRPWATWAAAAALAASVVAGVLWMRGAEVPGPTSTRTPQQPAPAVARDNTPAPAPPATGSAQPPTASSASPRSSAAPEPSPAARPEPSRTELIARLAVVTPPPYVSVPVRGEADEVARQFEAAMARYRARDYAAAAKGLRVVVEKSSESVVSAQFYLGVSELMAKQPARAEAALRRTVAADVTPYSDEAWFYLAKAALQREDLEAAEKALTEAIERDAGPGNEAKTLLQQVRALRQRK